jgi:hypothetical protein
VARNRDAVLAAFGRCQPHMAPGLTSHPVAQLSERLRKSPETSRGSLTP